MTDSGDIARDVAAGNHRQASTDPGPGTPPQIERGTCFIMLAYDIGLSVKLDQVESLITETTRRHQIRKRRHAPAHFEYDPPPICLSLAIEPLDVGGHRTTDFLEATLYDFGAVSFTYRISLRGPLANFVELSSDLYGNKALLDHAASQINRLMAAISPAVSKPRVASFVEDYIVYQVEAMQPEVTLEELIGANRHLLAQILRAENTPLGSSEVDDALSCRLSYGLDDLVLVDWNAAMAFDADADDVRAVLEYANVELLEMRWLDTQLDNALDEAYLALSRTSSPAQLLWTSQSNRLRRVAELQVDAALLFEGVNNALKLMGDQYLARLYRATSRRLHLDDWDASILRKLQSLESIYQKFSDHLSHQRMEVLEWIIIILIAVSILISILFPH